MRAKMQFTRSPAGQPCLFLIGRVQRVKDQRSFCVTVLAKGRKELLFGVRGCVLRAYQKSER